ncbi:Anaphase-promoting complex subunit 2 [Auxenochlorella protothecoides]|uniref:Anaphase-promoting complex subunit 2 n=1 Tax=Auxenochlorella protothecoides TaxID=3075 RepID=A0A087SST5_AUXPR|nr:Anaphase-promoting complex subunit 2 [Auxenochlorella protothecoides]KFM28789.1 Anaphase-promoting complex subunit 2 [Auxenochlorella protothecoides]
MLRRDTLAQLGRALQGCFQHTLDTLSRDDTGRALEEARSLAALLERMGAKELSVEAAVAGTLSHLQAHLEERATRNASAPWLAEALEYTASWPLRLLQQLLPEAGASGWHLWEQRLRYFVYERAGLIFTDSLFDLVVDFPDSLPTLHDLRACLENTSLLSHVAQCFAAATKKRLLHPGAATSDIVQQYIFSIRAMRHVDPTDTALAPARAATQDYLRTRRDAIRCIVGLLTADEEGEDNVVLEELEGEGEAGGAGVGWGMGVPLIPCFDGPDADLQALAEAERWRPEPVDAVERVTGSDAVSQLVGIWGSKDLLVTEYRSLLADRLLAKQGYDCDRELRTLELLKLRFGDAVLHTAEIMLKDLADSKRINANIRSAARCAARGERAATVTATMLSALYWPQGSVPAPDEADLRLPPDVGSWLEEYGQAYHALKAPRKLQWCPSQGVVQLEVTVGDQALELTVTPAQAITLLSFRERSEWGEAELAEQTGQTPAMARRNASFWAMAAYEPFILGMLANFDSLPQDRIHNMLKMFVSDPPYDKTLDQLSAFLAHLVAQERLTCGGGTMYKQKL